MGAFFFLFFFESGSHPWARSPSRAIFERVLIDLLVAHTAAVVMTELSLMELFAVLHEPA